MKRALWLGVGLLALLWTGCAALVAGLTDWAAQVLASGGVADWTRAAANVPVPPWIALWVDPQAVLFVQEAVRWVLDVLGSWGAALPTAGQLVGWLVPLVWLLWGLGLLLLLGLAAGAHWWLGRGASRRVT
ncbi:MAG: hypothetical protein ACOVN7_06575 [Rubrivivax sp.]|jgi:hypothetical protein